MIFFSERRNDTSYLNSDETKRSLVVGELTTELVEIDTHSFIANQIALKLEHGPVVSDSIKIFLKTTVPTSLNMSWIWETMGLYTEEIGNLILIVNINGHEAPNLLNRILSN